MAKTIVDPGPGPVAPGTGPAGPVGAANRDSTTNSTGPGGPAGSEPGSSAGSEPGSSAGSEPGSSAGSEPGSSAGSEPGSSAGSEPGSSAGSGPERPGGRAGRNLPAAIGVGLVLGALVTVPLFTVKPVFLAVVVAAVLGGLWELTVALRGHGLQVPFVPLAVGSVALLVLGYLRGSEAMVVAALLTTVAVVVWRLAEGRDGVLRDIGASAFTLVYVAFLAGFCVLLLVPSDGARRVTTFIATVVCSDVGGYAAGVVAGRHPMAPGISPKKSWEGFAGSLVACAVAGAVLVATLLHGAVWQGVLYGLAIACVATLGDLGESMIKRDLGIKDMGHLLPGHGGLMDRLDSLLPSAPVAWLLLTAFVPAVPH